MEAKLEASIARIVDQLVREFDPDQVVLFGSHAWGRPGEDSDLDLLVVVPSSSERPAARAARAHRCLRGIPLAMDLIVKTRAEMDALSKVPASLESEILDRGKILYGRGEAATGANLAEQGLT